MKRIAILGMICLILLTSCVFPAVSTTNIVASNYAECFALTGNYLICEFRLSDGVRCAAIVSIASNGGGGMTCNWK